MKRATHEVLQDRYKCVFGVAMQPGGHEPTMSLIWDLFPYLRMREKETLNRLAQVDENNFTMRLAAPSLLFNNWVHVFSYSTTRSPTQDAGMQWTKALLHEGFSHAVVAKYHKTNFVDRAVRYAKVHFAANLRDAAGYRVMAVGIATGECVLYVYALATENIDRHLFKDTSDLLPTSFMLSDKIVMTTTDRAYAAELRCLSPHMPTITYCAYCCAAMLRDGSCSCCRRMLVTPAEQDSNAAYVDGAIPERLFPALANLTAANNIYVPSLRPAQVWELRRLTERIFAGSMGVNLDENPRMRSIML